MSKDTDLTPAVVLGATKPGIGQAITLALLAQGRRVIGSYAPDENDLATEFGALHEQLELHELDLSSVTSIEAFVAQTPASIARVVNAEMDFGMETVGDSDAAALQHSIAVNLTGPHLFLDRITSRLAAGSSIVMISSTEAFRGSFGAAAYAATKAAIHNLVMTFANRLGPRGARINAVAAGWIGGVMDTDEIFEMSRAITPLGRLGTPEEIASIVVFLLGSNSSFVTGATVVADGGYTCVDSISKYEYEAEQK